MPHSILTHREHGGGVVPEAFTRTFSPEDRGAERSELQARLLRTIDKVPEQQRTIVRSLMSRR
jgi:hypothetical protein